MFALRIILALLALTAHASDDGAVAPQSNAVPTLTPPAA